MLLAIFAGLFAAGSTAQTAARQPNIVVILADDLGYGELGVQGNTEIPTPHIDSIAKAGVRFTNGYVSAPNCSPSRAGLLTGRYQTRFGHEFNPIGARNEEAGVGLPLGPKTVAELLHDVGYTTALVGKWHLGGSAPFHPQRRGFDTFYGFLHEGHFFIPPPWRGVTTMLRRRALPGGQQGRMTSGAVVYTTHMGHDEPPYDANNPILRAGQPVVEEAYLTDAITREAVEFIGLNAERPFFLFAAYNAVHSPLQGADAYIQRFASIEDVHRRIFAAMLANLDDGVGRILEELHGRGLERDTLVFFLSDNGGPTRELTSSNKPLRGEKSDVYEGGIRIPFMARWPGRIAEGGVEARPVISLDIAATALAAAGAAIPGNFDGVDLMPYLSGDREGRPHQTLYWRQGERTALRHGDWKLLRNPRRGQGGDWELYNLDADISESQNLAGDEPGRVEELKKIWMRLDGEMAERAF